MSKQRPLRIVHCIRAPVGGVFRHVADLARTQHAAGHSVGLICDSVTGGAFEDRRIADLKPYLRLGVTRVAMRRQISPSDLMASWRVAREIRKREPDVLHAHGAKGGAYARMIGALMRMRGHKVSRFYCPHGGSLHYDATSLQGRVYFTVERLLERVTDGLIFVCRYEADSYAAKVGTPTIPSKVVHNGVRPDEFIPVESVEDAADFLFIGTLRDLKGPDVFIRAVAELAENRNAMPRAVVVGDGDKKDAYVALAHELGIAEAIEFRGAMPARDAFALAHNVVIPSRAESLPYIVLETIAAHRPIVATSVGGVPEIFGADMGALVPPGDANALAGAMGRLLDDPEAAARRAGLRASRLGELFSLDIMAGEIEAFYRATLEGSPSPSREKSDAPPIAGHQMFIR